MKILVLNGPNLNLLGKREPEIYGSDNLDDLNENLKIYAETLDISCDFFQSNHEGEILDKIHSALENFDGIIINAGAFTHTSVAIMDALLGVDIPTVEVHLSNIYKREDFRHHSYISPASMGVICGFGVLGYQFALKALYEHHKSITKDK